MKIAAVQMQAILGEVKANCLAAESLAKQAFSSGAEMVILPEFFTSAMAFHPVMVQAARPLEGAPMELLKRLAREHDGIVGGSFNAIRQNDVYNTFVLAFPDGTTYLHDKDQPTMWENCYYLGGKDDGVMETPLGPIGAAVCWELVRSRTARRLRGKIKLLVGGSCWWSLPKMSIPGFPREIAHTMLDIMKVTPGKMARMVGAPIVHAAHAGDFKAQMPLLPGLPYESHLIGQTQITDAKGNILAKMDREDGEGFITADLDLNHRVQPTERVPDSFWIPSIPWQVRAIWAYQNWHGKWYYRLRTKRILGL